MAPRGPGHSETAGEPVVRTSGTNMVLLQQRKMKMRSFVLATTATVFASAVPEARADLVPPPPASCPEGSTASTSTADAYCRPYACTTSTDCSRDLSCQAVSACVTGFGCGGNYEHDGDLHGYGGHFHH